MPISEPVTFGERLRKVRLAEELSHQRFAELLGQTRNTIIKWESGDTSPTIPVIQQLQRLFGVDLNWLIDGHEPGQPYKGESQVRKEEIARTIDKFCDQAGYEPSPEVKSELAEIWNNHGKSIRGEDRRALRKLIFNMARERSD